LPEYKSGVADPVSDKDCSSTVHTFASKMAIPVKYITSDTGSKHVTSRQKVALK